MATTLEQHIVELRTLAETLMPYSFPKVKVEDDQEIIVLRTRQIMVDGFDIAVTFCISDYGKYQLESLQIQGIHTPFLPFSLVCKIARNFLGDQHLSYTDLVRENRKIYCWTIRKKKGRIVPIKKLGLSSYEGFDYTVFKLGKSN